MNKICDLINEEREFRFDELFFSTTDKSGKMTSWNNVFQRVSGYPHEQLIHKPHSLVRHPDMPRCVFQLLWDMLGQNQIVGAYVKNLASDGRYYWVYALVLPIEGGYLSIRLKPSSVYFELVKSVYADLLKIEKELESNGTKKSEIAKIVKQNLLDGLKSLGYSSYQSFMQSCLPAELIARQEKKVFSNQSIEEQMLTNEAALRTKQKQIATALIDKVSNFSNALSALFNDLSKSIELSAKVTANFKETSLLALEIKRGALNATIEAARLGSDGDALYVLADYLGVNGKKTIDDLVTAEQECKKSLSNVAEVLFIVCIAKLQTEMLTTFLSESFSSSNDHEQIMTVNRTSLLINNFVESIQGMTSQYGQLEESFSSVASVLSDLKRLFMSLKIAHVSARTVSSCIEQATRFGQVFDQVCTVVEQGKVALDTLGEQLDRYILILKDRQLLCHDLGQSALTINFESSVSL